MKQDQKRKFDLKAYRAISSAISTYEDTSILMDHLVEGLCRTFKIKGSSILLYDEREKQLFRVASWGLSDEYLRKGAMFMDEICQEFRQGKVLIFEDIRNDPRVKYAKDAIKEGIDFMMSIPIKYHKNLIGLLKLYDGEKRLFHPEDQESINVLMQQLGLVIVINGMKHFIDEVKSATEKLPLHLLQRENR